MHKRWAPGPAWGEPLARHMMDVKGDVSVRRAAEVAVSGTVHRAGLTIVSTTYFTGSIRCIPVPTTQWLRRLRVPSSGLLIAHVSRTCSYRFRAKL